MKKILKRMLITTSSLVLAMAMSIPSSAYSWCSDSDSVTYYEEIPEIRVRKMWVTSSFTRSLVESWVSFSASSWRTDTTYKIPNTFTSGVGEGDINIYAGKPQYLTEEYGVSFIDCNGNIYNGLTYCYGNTKEYVTINNTSKRIKKATHSVVYLIDKLQSGTSENVAYDSRSIYGHRNTVTHELGHALGYGGHSLYSGDIMTSGTSNTNLMSITTRDRMHLGQFINAYAPDTVTSLAIEPITYFEWREQEIEKANELEFVENTTNYVDNIIIGTPIKITQGSLESLDENEDMCEYLLTEYTFRVSDYIFGSEGESLITVRSQVGNIFELGKEYTFSTKHINNTLFDIYTVNSSKWVLDNSDLSETEIKSLTDNISSAATPCSISQSNEVVKCLEPTNSSVEHNVDVAFVATITSAEEDTVNNIYDIKVADVNFLKGNVDESILNEGIRIKGNISVGEKYLMMFTQDEDGFIMMAAREDSIIDVTSDKYNDYIVTFECNG